MQETIKIFLQSLSPKQKLLISVSSLILFISIIFYIFSSIKINSNKVSVEFHYAPFKSTVHLNGENYPNHHQVNIEPGKYQLVVTLEHFKTIEQTIEITSDQNQVFSAGLTPSDDLGKSIKKQYLSDYKSLEGFASLEANRKGEKEKSSYPILSILPTDKIIYKISYEFYSKKPTIIIHSEPIYIDTALQFLYSHLNLDPNLPSYRIVLSSYYENKFLDSTPTPSSATDPISFVKESYPNQFDDYQFKVFKYKNFTSLAFYYLSPDQHYKSETYRIVLKPKGQTWQIINYPYPIASRDNYPKVPLNILTELNTFEPEY